MGFVLGNIMAIVAAAVASWIFGAVWYGVLGKQWMAATGLTAEDVKPGGKTNFEPFVTSFILELWMATLLASALILAPADETDMRVALSTAFAIWIGFVMPTQVINHRYSMKPWSLTLIDCAHWYGVLTVQAAVLVLTGVQ